MSATTELLELYKDQLSLTSDLAAAKSLGVKAQTVSNWRTRGSQAEPWLLDKMCRSTGQRTAKWVLRAVAEQAHDSANRRIWKKLASQLGVVVPAALILFSGMQDAVTGSVETLVGPVLGMAQGAIQTLIVSEDILLAVI